MTGSTGKESGEATRVKQENGMISSLLTKCYREQIVQKQMLACHGQSLRHLLRMFPGNRCSKLRAMAKRLEECPRCLPLWLVRWCLVSLHMLQFLTQFLHLVLIQSPLGLIFSNSIKVASAEGNVSTLKNKTKLKYIPEYPFRILYFQPYRRTQKYPMDLYSALNTSFRVVLREASSCHNLGNHTNHMGRGGGGHDTHMQPPLSAGRQKSSHTRQLL